VPAVAVKVAEEAPPATVTEAGVESTELLSEIATARPPEGAAWESVTVQVADALELREVGEQAREVKVAGATRDNAADCEAPLRVAVTVADWLDETVPAVAVKVAEDAPLAAVTEAGTEITAVLSEIATARPPEGAA